MGRIYTDEDIKNLILQTDCKLILIEKKECTYLHLRCNCGEYFIATLNDFKNRGKKQCNKCGRKNMANKQKYSFEYVKNYIENTGYKLLSTEYTSCKQLLELICSKGHKYTASFSSFKKGYGCKICSGHYKDTKMYKEQLKNIQNGEFEVLEDYQKGYIVIKHRHKICGKEFKTSPNNFISSPGCPKCRKTHRWNNELIREKIFELYGNEYELLEDFKTAEQRHLFKHNVCGNEYLVAISQFLIGNKCPYCYGNIKLTTEQYQTRVKEATDNEYIILEEYINSQTKILHKHLKCGNEFLMTPSSFLYQDQRCPKCQRSKGENNITQWLINNNINYIPQYKFNDCKNIRPLPFDFAIFNENNHLYCLIEFDGEQHFKWRGYRMSYEKFLDLQYRDNLKNQYCKDNNIPLLRISYKDFKKINEILDKELELLKTDIKKAM